MCLTDGDEEERYLMYSLRQLSGLVQEHEERLVLARERKQQAERTLAVGQRTLLAG